MAKRDTGAVPKLSDVARLADVSTATVSRSINTPQRVRREVRERVQAAIRELGYAPNFGAQALAAKRTNTYGAIVPTMENAIFARGIQAFQEELGKNGVTLLVASSSYSAELEERQIRALIARGADALLLIGHDRTPESYAFLEAQGVPFVVTWAFDANAERLAVGFDNRAAMRTLTDAVLDLGHRRIGLITAQRRENDRARARFEGLCDAMAARGLPEDALQVIETTYAIANGAEGFEALMAHQAPPTAVLCGNDVLAAGALRRARELGVRVPEDVSITGFDDIEIAEIVTPSLTTVHVPHRTMGRVAAQKLLALRDDKEQEIAHELETYIVWRKSLGPAPAKG